MARTLCCLFVSFFACSEVHAQKKTPTTQAKWIANPSWAEILRRLPGNLIDTTKYPTVVSLFSGPPEKGFKVDALAYTEWAVASKRDVHGILDWEVRATIRVPVDVRFTIDYLEIDGNSVWWHSERQILKIKLPSPRLEKLLPDFDREETLEKIYPFGWASGQWYELRDDARKDATEVARQAATLNLGEAEKRGRENLKLLLKRVIPIPEIVIDVE